MAFRPCFATGLALSFALRNICNNYSFNRNISITLINGLFQKNESQISITMFSQYENFFTYNVVSIYHQPHNDFLRVLILKLNYMENGIIKIYNLPLKHIGDRVSGSRLIFSSFCSDPGKNFQNGMKIYIKHCWEGPKIKLVRK